MVCQMDQEQHVSAVVILSNKSNMVVKYRKIKFCGQIVYQLWYDEYSKCTGVTKNSKSKRFLNVTLSDNRILLHVYKK